MTEQTDDRPRTKLMQRFTDLVPARWRRGAAIVPVVRLSGVIGAVTPLRPGMSLAGVAKTLERAFSTKNAKAVALVINSPGGSPVQSRQIYLRIRQLAADKKLPVLVFVEGRRGIRRLYDRLRRGRDFLRSVVDPGFDRRGRRLVRIQD